MLLVYPVPNLFKGRPDIAGQVARHNDNPEPFCPHVAFLPSTIFRLTVILRANFTLVDFYVQNPADHLQVLTIVADTGIEV